MYVKKLIILLLSSYLNNISFQNIGVYLGTVTRFSDGKPEVDLQNFSMTVSNSS